MTQQNSYTKSQAAKILGITPRTVHYYTDEGLVTPEIANPTGRGTTRKYSRKNLADILVVREMVESGVPISDVKIILKKARDKKLDAKWDPDGRWGWQDENKTAVLIIYEPRSENPDIEMTTRKSVLSRLAGKKRAIIINIEEIYIQLENL